MKDKLREACSSKLGCVEKYIDDWSAFNYTVGDKMFSIIGVDKHKKPIISLKCDPFLSQRLRDDYEAINPGYYLNKVHWISIYYEDDVPLDLIISLIEESYKLIFNSLTKKKQKEIVEQQKTH